MGSPQNEWGKDTSAFMQLALDQAKLALDNLEVPVGCVIVEEAKVIASGRNRTNETRNATRHAEMDAIDTLLEQWQQQGSSTAEVAEKFLKCSLFVSCEPYIMCAATLSIIGIKEVYFGCANDKFGGCGSILSLHSSGIGPSVSNGHSQSRSFKCYGGIMASEAISLLRDFYEQGNPNAGGKGSMIVIQPVISNVETDVVSSKSKMRTWRSGDLRSRIYPECLVDSSDTLEETKRATWNEMGNRNASLKEEGNVSAKVTTKSPLDDAPEEAEAVLHLSDEAETTDEARQESPQDEAGRDDMKHKSQQILAEEPANPPREAEELALDSKNETGPMDGCVSTVQDGSEKVDTSTLPEVGEEPNRQEHEDVWQGKRITPFICMSLEDAALTPDTNAKSAVAEGGTEKSTKSRSNDTGMETSLVGKGELLGPSEPKAGGLSASNELGSVDGKGSAIASTLPSFANKDDTLEEIDATLEASISTVQNIREDDDTLMEETDNALAEMKSLEMEEPADPVQNSGDVTDSIEKTRRNSFSSLDLDNAILHRDQSIHLQPDDTRVKDESIILDKLTDLIGIPSTTDIRKVGGQFECGADRSPSEDALAPNLKNTDARTKIVGDLECPVDEEGEFEAVKATEYGIIDEGFPTPREECFVRLTRGISTIAESKEVVDGIAEAEKPTEDTNSGIKSNARVSYEEFQAFDPLKLNQPELFPLPINEEASKVESDGGDGLPREDTEALGSRRHRSKPDKAINLRMKKSPSFDFDLRITRTEESDRTPLLFQDKRVVRTATAMTANHGNAEKKKFPIAKERILSFCHADSRTPSLCFSRDEHDVGGFHNRDISEKQERVLLLDPAKDLEVVDRPSSAEQKGNRRPRSSLFGSCMCCATVMN